MEEREREVRRGHGWLQEGTGSLQEVVDSHWTRKRSIQRIDAKGCPSDGSFGRHSWRQQTILRSILRSNRRTHLWKRYSITINTRHSHLNGRT
jgi:hypothetical protein